MLPLVHLGMLAGLGMEAERLAAANLLHAVLFVLGFSLLFVISVLPGCAEPSRKLPGSSDQQGGPGIGASLIGVVRIPSSRAIVA